MQAEKRKHRSTSQHAPSHSSSSTSSAASNQGVKYYVVAGLSLTSYGLSALQPFLAIVSDQSVNSLTPNKLHFHPEQETISIRQHPDTMATSNNLLRQLCPATNSLTPCITGKA
ncbi:hypothetical protein BaRGS_00020049 [Batillaria attramentaria]|uniref:Uncharacterized protein n=1 Tax=Batillaria attramentaria TaxID=370345 RepID=A0ABD0KNQ1_9CAEN